MKDIISKCQMCGLNLSGKQRKFCSTKCKHKSQNNKAMNYTAQVKRANERKIKLITMCGGKCQSCGYSNNPAALTFHHKHDKLFELKTRYLSNKSWESILKEVKKCLLLCLNCHLELHNPNMEI